MLLELSARIMLRKEWRVSLEGTVSLILLAKALSVHLWSLSTEQREAGNGMADVCFFLFFYQSPFYCDLDPVNKEVGSGNMPNVSTKAPSIKLQSWSSEQGLLVVMWLMSLPKPLLIL